MGFVPFYWEISDKPKVKRSVLDRITEFIFGARIFRTFKESRTELEFGFSVFYYEDLGIYRF